MTKFAVDHNVTDRPLVVDDDGSFIGGGEWGAVRFHASPASGHIAVGHLVVSDVDPEGRDLDPGARAAARKAAELEKAEAPDPTGPPTKAPRASKES